MWIQGKNLGHFNFSLLIQLVDYLSTVVWHKIVVDVSSDVSWQWPRLSVQTKAFEMVQLIHQSSKGIFQE